MKPYKPILTVDFDGVIHSYSGGWKGATIIEDVPVPGALEFLVTALDVFNVHILSSRSHQWGGRRAMKRYLLKHLINIASGGATPVPPWWMERICRQSTMDPWSVQVQDSAEGVIKEIKWPVFKPQGHVTLDDRAITFTGVFPPLTTLRAFKPWNKVYP